MATLKSAATRPVTGSENVTGRAKVPICVPAGGVSVTVGITVSMGTTACVAAVFALPAGSVAVFAATSMVTEAVELDAGVTSNVYV